MIRACLEAPRIGQYSFNIRRFMLEHFLKKFVAVQKYVQGFGIHTFHLITNNNNRSWLICISNVYGGERQVGGFYQTRQSSYFIQGLDYGVVPGFMYPKNEDFTNLDLKTMFMWMSSYPHLIEDYGFRHVFLQPPEEQYINGQSFFEDFLLE